ncbi:MAG: hypothetical protein F4X11_08015 [Acidobacteria bacterium]|nr:hypothetical protein [Acidobacteriota bacterium]
MRNTLKEQRIRLFERGNDRCPICLTVFTRQDVERGVASLEHVPAKSLGTTRPIAMCLTCADCNSRTGRVEQRVADVVHAERRGGEKVTLTIPGLPKQSVRMTVQPNGDIVAAMPEKTRIPPDEFMKAMKAGEITIRSCVPTPKAARMPWLKAAYLSVFSLLGRCGYWYAKGAAIRQIRGQIWEPSKEIIPTPILRGVGPHPIWPQGGIHMDRAGGHWMVKIGDRLIPLPTSADESLYERLAREWSLPQGGVAEINYTTSGGPLWYPLKFGEAPAFTISVSNSGVAFASTGTVTATGNDDSASFRFVVADSRDQALTGLLTDRLMPTP